MEKIQIDLERPIAFFPQLARALGGIEEAIFVQQLYYWSDKGRNKDGWIYKTKTEWEEETCLTREQQDRIRKKLEKKGILQTVLKKANGVPTLHYKLDIAMVQKALMDKCEIHQPISVKDTNPLKTETTTETTTENKKDDNEDIISKSKDLRELSEKEFSYKKEIDDLIDKFKEVNPTHDRLFGNTTQRSAMGRLVKKFGVEKIGGLIDYLPKTNQMIYAPIITTPFMLEIKLAQLIAFIQREKVESEKNKIVEI